jgi:hypothetical protein
MRDVADPALARARREILALAALAGLLAALAGWQFLGLDEEAAPNIAMPVARPAAPAAGTAVAAPPALAEILERPVFAPGRRRIVPIAEAQAAPPPPPPARPPLSASHVLMGWTTTDGQLVAWLRQQSGGRVIRLRAGEGLDGWTLAGTAGRRMLVFERNGARQTLGVPGGAAGTPDEEAASEGDMTEDDN